MNKKVIVIIFMAILLSSLLVGFNKVYGGTSYNDVSNPSIFMNATDNSSASTEVKSLLDSAVVVVQVVATGVAVIMLLVLGIKYMSSAPNDRAEIKKHAFVYVVGALIIFAVSGILQIIKSFASNIGGSTSGG